MEPVLLTGDVYSDHRGFFRELFNRRQHALQDVDFVQDNHSRSKKGVLRGLHYQLPPSAQGKLITVIRGSIFDVAVDIRRSSPSFGEWFGQDLDDVNHGEFWVPEGFAHGFLALTDADVLYKVSAYHDPEAERAIRWDDPDIGVEWPLDGIEPELSAQDADAPSLREAEVFD